MSDELRDFIHDFGSVLIYAPTNGGKTTLCKYLVELIEFEHLKVFTTATDYEDW